MAKDVVALTPIIMNLEKTYAPLLVSEVEQFIVTEEKACCKCFAGLCAKKPKK